MKNITIKLSIFIIACIICRGNVLAQSNNYVDSLMHITNNNVHDTVKLRAYCLLLLQSHKDTSINYVKIFDDGISLTKNVSDKKYKIELYNSLGTKLKFLSKLDEAILAYQTSLDLSIQTGNKKYIAINNNNLANCYNNQGKYLSAIDLYLKALKIFEEIDMQTKAASVMMSVGNVYADQHMPEKALVYYESSLKIKQQLKDSNGIAANLVNIGSIYYDTKNYLKALDIFKQAKDISERIGFKRGVFVTLNNIGDIYDKLGNYKECLKYQLKSLEIRRANGELIDISLALIQLGNTYIKLNKPALAKPYFEEADLINKQVNSFENYAALYNGYALLYEKTGDFVKSNFYLKLFIQFNDSLYNENKYNQIAELETKYQTEKKDLEISEQALLIENSALEISKRKSQLLMLLITIAAILSLSYLFYNRYKLKQKALLDAELLHQQEMRNKAIIEAEEKERIRIAKDLHDGVGQQLSAVKMHLSAFGEGLENKTAEVEDKYQLLLNLVDDAVKEVRAVSHNMMPNALLTSGINAAFREFVNKISTTGALKADLQIVGLSERLDSSTETVLYRVLQECVSNIVKHAHANYVSIQLIKHTDYLNMIIEDNGRGFDTTKVNDFDGIGLKNIISRVQFLDGTVDFDSFIGKGTTVSISIPL